jgi:hypothetical protein
MLEVLSHSTGKQKRKGFSEGIDEIENNPEIRTREQLDEILALESDEGALVDGVVPEDPEQSALTIDESVVPKEEAVEESTPKGRKAPAAKSASSAKGKGVKRKASSDTPTTPAPPPKQQKTSAVATPASAASSEPERTSRSGRVIKAKKFDDSSLDAKQVIICYQAIICTVKATQLCYFVRMKRVLKLKARRRRNRARCLSA